MRLIDADMLIEQFEKVKNESTCLADIAQIIGVQCVIDEQPTAYDVDKVVEQLEERTTFLKECTKYGNKDAEQQEKSYATMMMYEVAYLVDDLLEIVKGGGVDGD